MGKAKTSWRERSEVFHDMADDYDKWFEGSLLFDIELAAIREVQTPLADPKIEIGVGSGRFAQSLGVFCGIDPAFAPLKLARSRGINVIQAIGEELPFAGGSAGSIFILFTLCFLFEPKQVIAECHRILKPGGHLVFGMVPVSGAWGRALHAKKESNHPFYRHASFYAVRQAADLLREAEFSLVECRATLFQKPEELREVEYSRPGLDETAGFCLLVGEKG